MVLNFNEIFGLTQYIELIELEACSIKHFMSL